MDKNNKLLELISKEYREKLSQLRIIDEKIKEIYHQIADKNVSHQKYLELSEEMVELKKQYEENRFIADGISISREIVMEYLYK
jgi:DNA-binding transcriptional regulator GbsR (MarR family)